MKVILRDEKFIAVSSFEERAIPKDAGFRWDPAGKRWWTADRATAARLAQYATDDVRAQLSAIAEKQVVALESSRATDAAIEIPCPDGLAYLPYQRAGIARGIEILRERGFLLADEPGLGKTIQALGIINALPEIQRVLVICPASLKINWSREAAKWLVRKFDIQIANGKPIDMSTPDRGQMVIVNYDVLKKHKDALIAMHFDLLVMDECHFVKNSDRKKIEENGVERWAYKTQRTDIAVQIAASCRRKILMTGTPICNRTREAFVPLSILDPDRWSNFFKFGIRYAGAYRTKWGWDFSGATNLDELQRILRETVMVRRLKKDVLTELPAKRRQVIEIPANGCSAVVAAEMAAETRQEFRHEAIEARRDQADAFDDRGTYEAAVAELRESRQAAFAEMSKLRHATALVKVDYVVEHAKELLDATDKIIIFAHHHDVVTALMAGLAEFSPVQLTGENSTSEKQASIDAFQNRPDVRVFVGSITAAGMGITLTAASTVVFAELDWVPGNMTQAEDRAHRIGQTDSVLVQHIVLDGSMDAKLAKTLVSKQDVIDRALDKQAPAAMEAGEAIEREEKPKRQSPADLPDMSAEEIAFMHSQIRRIAGMCDGAQQRDGAGFNRTDTDFGKSLAAASELTQKQAKYAARLVRKYGRQLREVSND